MINFQQLAKSEYYETLRDEFQKEIDSLMQPDEFPTDDLESVKAHILHVQYLKDKIAELKKLRNKETVVYKSNNKPKARFQGMTTE